MSKEKKKRTKTIFLAKIFFNYLSLSLSLSDTLSYVQDWRHQGSMTGYSLCSTPQPDNDFLLMDQIIGAIIIPNHKEMAHTIQEKKFFSLTLSHVHQKICAHSDWYCLYEISSHSAVSFRKEMKPDRESVSTSIIHNDTCQSKSYRKKQTL